MKQTAKIISTYSADAFGVCSALFELGGMTIIHDASGCNSTYTTHDEPRWYDMDSMVYISALTEMEAIMGDDEKLIGDIEEAAAELKPAFIAVCGTPIPMMTGFDFEAVAEVIETRTGIPAFGFPTSGMKTYIDGASMALAGIAERFVGEVSEDEIAHPVGVFRKAASLGSVSVKEQALSFFDKTRVNILGLTPLDFSVNGMDGSLCKWLMENGFDIISKWAMGSTLDEIRKSAAADVNLVVSAAGLGAAEVLYQRFGIPYVTGLPIGDEQSRLLKDALNEAAFKSRALRHSDHKDDRSGIENKVITSRLAASTGAGGSDDFADIVLVGEGVTNLAIASAIEFETGRVTRVLCAAECPEGILRDGDRMTPDEDDIIPELAGAKVIIADPLYQPICPPEAKFISLPTEAFSGRIYRKDIPDLIAHFCEFAEKLQQGE